MTDKSFQPDVTRFFAPFIETQRRNMEAFTEAQQNVIHSWQALTQKQVQMVSQLVQDNAELAQQIMKEGTPEEKVAKQTELFKRAYAVSLTQSRELAGMLAQSGKETADIINRRISDSINEIKDSVQKNSKAA